MPQNQSGIYGWNSYDPIFAELIGRVQPRLICEVGSWLGASALHMASLAPDATIYCVDTWKGSPEHRSFEHLPRLFDDFMANVRKAGAESRVIPLRMTSAEGFHRLTAEGVLFDLIYIDGSHDEADVKADIANYWRLLRDGGVLFGDDWNEWATVRRAAEAHGKPTVVRNHWYFTK